MSVCTLFFFFHSLHHQRVVLQNSYINWALPVVLSFASTHINLREHGKEIGNFVYIFFFFSPFTLHFVFNKFPEQNCYRHLIRRLLIFICSIAVNVFCTVISNTMCCALCRQRVYRSNSAMHLQIENRQITAKINEKKRKLPFLLRRTNEAINV